MQFLFPMRANMDHERIGQPIGLSQQKIKSFSYEKIGDVRPANVSVMPRKITKLHDDLTECSFVVQV